MLFIYYWNDKIKMYIILSRNINILIIKYNNNKHIKTKKNNKYNNKKINPIKSYPTDSNPNPIKLSTSSLD